MTTESIEDINGNDLEISQKRNDGIVGLLIEEHPLKFYELFLEDGSRVAMFQNFPLVRSERVSEYEYVGLSKYGLTEFDSSCKRPLGYDVIVKCISKLIELSNGNEIEELAISEWRKPVRNRINKGFFKLEAIIRTIYITGRNMPNRVEGFYEELSHPT